MLMMIGGGGFVQPFTAWSVIADNTPGNLATATFSMNQDGSCSKLETPSDGGSVAGSPGWYSPIGGTPGASLFVRFTVTAGTATTNDASSFVALNTTRSIAKGNTAGTNSCTFTIEVATDAGGTNIVFTSSGNIVRNQHTL